ncbi:hypothetical protein QD712_20855 [Streptomyces acidiscabies]|uniref:hypothetical protein n=1 Tax=Streptomyces acidiscabies TaxID=42234 RepID=UPI0030CB7E7D
MEFVARQVRVPASELGLYEWTGRTVEYHPRSDPGAPRLLTTLVSSRLTAESVERIMTLVAGGTDQDDAGPADGGAEGEDVPPVLRRIKKAPGHMSLETMLEIDKLLAVRAIGLPPDLLIDVARKVLAG